MVELGDEDRAAMALDATTEIDADLVNRLEARLLSTQLEAEDRVLLQQQ
jgi:hypothetical protein